MEAPADTRQKSNSPSKTGQSVYSPIWTVITRRNSVRSARSIRLNSSDPAFSLMDTYIWTCFAPNRGHFLVKFVSENQCIHRYETESFLPEWQDEVSVYTSQKTDIERRFRRVKSLFYKLT